MDNQDNQENHQELIKNNKLILTAQKRFRSEKHDVSTEEINKIALSSNDDKIIQSINLVEKFAYGTSKDLVCKKEEIKCNNMKKYNTKNNIQNNTTIKQYKK